MNKDSVETLLVEEGGVMPNIQPPMFSDKPLHD